MPIILGIYSQLPYASPLKVLERALLEGYKPLLTHIYKNPSLKLHLYFSANIYEWFEANHPEMNMLIADLVKKEQLELLSGPYYQSILHLMPPKDRSGQIEKTTTLLRKRFGKRSKTVWFYNQIWSPAYVASMALGSLDRLLISPYNRLTDCSVATEPFKMHDLGKTIEVFTTDDRIDLLIDKLATMQLTKVQFVEQLNELSWDINTTYYISMINLDKLLQATALNGELGTPLELFELIIEKLNSTNSEFELLNTIKVDQLDSRGFLGSSWYGRDSQLTDLNSFNELFLKYEELNHLYGRILATTEMLRIVKPNKDIKKRVESLLERATSGGAFVLDSSGGVYRNIYRKHNYRYINEALKLLNKSENISFPQELDIDFDGTKEVLWQGKNLSLVIDKRGATLAQLNYLPTGWNYGDTFTGYQNEVTRLSMHHLVDGSFQRSFNDLFIPSKVDLENFAKSVDTHCYDSSNVEYTVIENPENKNSLICTKEFNNLPFNFNSIEVVKTFIFKTNTIVVEYKITNKGKRAFKGFFGSELNLSVGLKNSDEISLYTVEKSKNRFLNGEKSINHNLKNFRLVDELNRTIISFAAEKRFTLLKENFKVEAPTIMGNEVLYQYTQFLPIWEMELNSGEAMELTIGFRIERRSRKEK